MPVVGLGLAAGFAGFAGFDGCCRAGVVGVGFFLGCLPLYWHLGMESPQTGHFLLGAWADMPKENTAKSRKNNIFFIMSYEFFQNSTRLAGVLNKSNNSNESNKSYTLRGALLISSMFGCARQSMQASLMLCSHLHNHSVTGRTL